MKLDASAFVADPELIRALQERSSAIPCEGSRVLFRQGESPDALYILEDGEATLTMTSVTGKNILAMQAGAGSLLGLPGLIGNLPYTLTAVAREGARISVLGREEFTGMMQACPQLALKVLQVLAAEVSSARRALSDAQRDALPGL